jgi:ATP-dependent RNA helicase DHX57
MFLEDALEATGFLVGKTSKWAKRSGTGTGGGGGGGGKKKGGDADGGASMLGQGYSEQTRQSLANIDEAMVNTDLIEALVAQVLGSRQRQQQPEGAGGGGKRGGGGDDASAILIFAPGGRPL